ncbi:TIGR03885 family FMN-dependent LLM class oxidoreductase [Pseudactinotalea terrae]|uniref:TIGR03885 family FMN-dependent LLM class oxidoreductase n=1 Tax=Pseudactinotalea terrae TaxID=1743262 RepID=UPI0012E292B2|nr:TIGR03885 family FMN-dependent LLM class oxidoreductase [Pseudactinotalea terrae]
MVRVGFHASHEQISPRQLLVDLQHAERAGFQMAMCSDHLAPWSVEQGHSGYAWSWLAAALATTDLELGCVSAPGQRYHPAVHAQKIATLGQMFPGRFWVALGSGEAVNEHVTGERWPAKAEREQRLDECVSIIRRLLEGKEVSHTGAVTVDRARLWERADPRPRLIAPVVSVESAARVAAWAEGMVTLNQPHERLREVVDAYRGAGGSGPLSLQVHLSWAPTQQQAEDIAVQQWRGNVVGPPLTWDIDTPAGFDTIAAHLPRTSTLAAVRASADLGQHIAWLREYAELGFEDIYLHHVGQQQADFIDAFAGEVIPALVS